MGKGGGAEVVLAAVKTKGAGAEEVPATTKTKKVMRRLPQDYVDYALAMEPKEPARFPAGSERKRLSEECRCHSARVNELIRRNHEHIRTIQEHYRRELDTATTRSRSRSMSMWKSSHGF